MKREYPPVALDTRPYTESESFSIRWQLDEIDNDSELVVEIVLADLADNSRKLRLTCHDVTNIRLPTPVHFNPGLGEVMVEDIREYQWSGIKYHVTNYEHEFSFYCHSFEVSYF